MAELGFEPELALCSHPAEPAASYLWTEQLEFQAHLYPVKLL